MLAEPGSAQRQGQGHVAQRLAGLERAREHVVAAVVDDLGGVEDLQSAVGQRHSVMDAGLHSVTRYAPLSVAQVNVGPQGAHRLAGPGRGQDHEPHAVLRCQRRTGGADGGEGVGHFEVVKRPVVSLSLRHRGKGAVYEFARTACAAGDVVTAGSEQTSRRRAVKRYLPMDSPTSAGGSAQTRCPRLPHRLLRDATLWVKSPSRSGQSCGGACAAKRRSSTTSSARPGLAAFDPGPAVGQRFWCPFVLRQISLRTGEFGAVDLRFGLNPGLCCSPRPALVKDQQSLPKLGHDCGIVEIPPGVV